MIQKKFKAIVGIMEKNMQKQAQKECLYNHTPNKDTIQAIKNSKKKENLTKAKNAKNLFKKLGL